MKETFYLQHDYNSRNDEKVLRLRQKYPNANGYGIYWMLLEKLAESSEGRLQINDIEVIAFELHLDSEWIADVIHNYGLFTIENDFWWSDRLLEDLEKRADKSNKAILANKIRWEKERQKAVIVRTDSKRTPSGIQGEERRGEEKKGESGDKNPPKNKYGEDSLVLLTDQQYKALCVKYGWKNVEKFITRLNNYIASIGRRYKSHYHTILKWIDKDKQEGKFKPTWSDFREEDFDTPEDYQKIITKYQ